MAKGRQALLVPLLIAVGTAFVALNLWFLATAYPIPVPARGKLALGALGLTMLISGVMLLQGARPNCNGPWS